MFCKELELMSQVNTTKGLLQHQLLTAVYAGFFLPT